MAYVDDMTEAMPEEGAAPEVQPQIPEMRPEEFVAVVSQADNLVPELGEDEAADIAQKVIEDYDTDRESMADWLDRMKKGLDLAKLTKEEKTYPFAKAANIKYPLITSAALQFNARAYPAIVPADAPVKCTVNGEDPDGAKADRAQRVSTYTSHQLMTEIDEWEELTDRLLTMLPIVGTMVRKQYFDPIEGRICYKLIEPGDFVVNDKTKSLVSAGRVSERMWLQPFEIAERELSGWFVECDYDDDEKQKAVEFIEQRRRIDLDGDGYPEPYIATVAREKGKLVRLVSDFDPQDVRYAQEADGFGQPMNGRIVSIRGGSYYTAFHFLPSMDGSFFGTGLGLLLGDISDAINGALNQIYDAAHMQSLGAGFLGREFRQKGGDYRFRPGEWKQVQVGGDDVRKSMVPLELPGPSPVMFQILGLLIEAGREIASVKDVMTGDSGPRAMTATATMALIEQGMMVFSAAYKRVYQSMRREYKMLARLNAKHVTPEQYNAFLDGQGQFDPAADFDLSDMDITPVADPRAVTQMQKMAKAQLVKEMAGEGLVDPRVAARRILEAAAVDGVDELAPEPTPEDMQRAAMEAQQTELIQRIGLATAEAELMKVLAEIEKLKADTEKARASGVKDLAQADEASAGIRLAAMIQTLRTLKDEVAGARGIGGMAGAPGDGMPVQPPAPRIEPAPPMDAGGLVGGGGGFGGGPQGLAGGFGDSGAVPQPY